MDMAAAEHCLRSKITVTPTMVALAKKCVLDVVRSGDVAFEAIAKEVLRRQGISMPAKIIVNPAYDADHDITTAAKGMGWRLATAEALWALVHSGHFIHMSGEASVQCRVDMTTIPPGGGSGMSAGWEFRDLEMVAPSKVRLAVSQLGRDDQYLTDPDLFIGEISIASMHAEIAEALRESVRCFRHDLYTAAVAMLGKVSEGAWLELGAALLRVAGPAEAASTFKKASDVLEDPMTGPLKKVGAVLQMYERRDRFPSVIAKCGVRDVDLRQVQQWSDTLRDSRNTIHFGVDPSLPNTYEKVSVLLLAAAPNLRTLYAVKEAADSFPPGTV